MRLAPKTACRPSRRSATAGPLRRAALLAALAVMAAVAGPSQAGSRLMLPEAQQAEWLAVGRLNVSGQGYCTATLIAPDMVMTAGHCVVDRRTGRPVEAANIRWEKGDVVIWPNPVGAHNWQAQAYSPQTGLIYIPVMHNGVRYSKRHTSSGSMVTLERIGDGDGNDSNDGIP